MSTRSEATISYVGWASNDLAVFDEDSYGADDPAGYRDMDASMGASMGLGPQRLEPMFASQGVALCGKIRWSEEHHRRV